MAAASAVPSLDTATTELRVSAASSDKVTGRDTVRGRLRLNHSRTTELRRERAPGAGAFPHRLEAGTHQATKLRDNEREVRLPAQLLGHHEHLVHDAVVDPGTAPQTRPIGEERDDRVVNVLPRRQPASHVEPCHELTLQQPPDRGPQASVTGLRLCRTCAPTHQG
ncbi:hypothetical protein Aglo03_07840 [Actinokineospora globicatena]|uniref:Uncharacterized protein n=1 Tax=Actinokineospora globicatena TaxID=103729 RepID=A0A9W6QKN7_9PSEU|nr:hypothetical protein Aglo03_07840 [Actinokineospora globicatena]